MHTIKKCRFATRAIDHELGELPTSMAFIIIKSHIGITVSRFKITIKAQYDI